MRKSRQTSNSYMLIVITIIALLSSLRIAQCEYPVSQSTDKQLPALSYGAGFVINGTMYVYGGQLQDGTISNRFTKLSFDKYGDVHYENVNSNGPKMLYAQSVVSSKNDSVAFIGGWYPEHSPNSTNPIRIETYSFVQNTWTTLAGSNEADRIPVNRQEHTAVKAANGLIYIHGGVTTSGNHSAIKDSWSYDPITRTFKNMTAPPIALYGSTATVLPNGRILYVGGQYNGDKMGLESSEHFDYDQSAVYNPDDDSWNIQALNADAIAGLDQNQLDADNVLGPEGRYLYFFGVSSLGYVGINDIYHTILWILDTHTWTWSAPTTAGVLPRARIGSSIGRINNEYAVICFGIADEVPLNDIDILKLSDTTKNNNSGNEEGVLALAPPEWVYNMLTGDTYNDANEGPTTGIGRNAIIGIVCGGLVCFVCIYIIFRYTSCIKRAMNIPCYPMIQARAGEPLWAEAMRLVSKFFLLLFFIAFFVFLIIQVLESPKVTYTFSTPESNKIQLPDIRFCLHGSSIPEDTTDRSTYQPISCKTTDGISCDDYVTLLDLSYHKPKLDIYLYEKTQCYLFRGDPFNNSLAPLRLAPVSISQSNNGTAIYFSFRVSNTTEDGRIYISFYHPQRDPNPNVYFDERSPLFSDQEINEWILEDASRMPGDYLEPSEVAYADYQFEVTESLTDSGWNYFGFASLYNSTPQVTTTLQKYSGSSDGYFQNAAIILSPSSFTTVVKREQKIYSLVNALGFVGGLYGLITAIQTVMFGYRPQSPFGIIHHWSFGHMQRSIYRGLEDRFSQYNSPVPLVNPVHSRYEPLLYNDMTKKKSSDEQNENQRNDPPGSACSNDDDSNSKPRASGERKQFTALDVDEKLPQGDNYCQHYVAVIQEQARHIALIQDRTQLLEHLFKSYYVDDEVFQKVDTAIKQPERQKNQQPSSSNFLHRRRFQDIFQRSKSHTGYQNTMSSDNITVASNSNIISDPL